MFQLGLLYKKKGKFEEAKRMLVTVWEVHKKTFGDVDPRTLNAMFNVAKLYEDRHMYVVDHSIISSIQYTVYIYIYMYDIQIHN